MAWERGYCVATMRLHVDVTRGETSNIQIIRLIDIAGQGFTDPGNSMFHCVLFLCVLKFIGFISPVHFSTPQSPPSSQMFPATVAQSTQ